MHVLANPAGLNHFEPHAQVGIFVLRRLADAPPVCDAASQLNAASLPITRCRRADLRMDEGAISDSPPNPQDPNGARAPVFCAS